MFACSFVRANPDLEQREQKHKQYSFGPDDLIMNAATAPILHFPINGKKVYSQTFGEIRRDPTEMTEGDSCRNDVYTLFTEKVRAAIPTRASAPPPKPV